MSWYSGLPSAQTCMAQDPNFSCLFPHSLYSDADIAGHHGFIGFVAAAIATMVVGVFGLIYEGWQYRGGSGHKYAQRTRDYVDVFLVRLGDTQILTSIALLITANFSVGCKISAYHYDLVCKLVLISSAAHIGSMAFVHKYFSRSRLLGAIRISLITLSLDLGWILFSRRRSSPIFPMAKPNSIIRNANGTINTGLVLPASCFIEHPGVSATTSYNNFTASPYWITNVTSTVATNSSNGLGSTNSSTSSVSGMIMKNFQQFNSNDALSNGDFTAYIAVSVALGLTIVASLLLHWIGDIEKKDPEESRAMHWLAYGLRVLSFIIIYTVMFVDFQQFRILQNWMKQSGWFGEDNRERNGHSFGQMMQLILLLLPILALFEEKSSFKKWSKIIGKANGSASSISRLIKDDGEDV